MKKVELIGCPKAGSWGGHTFAPIIKQEEGVFKTIQSFKGCRAWIGDATFKHKTKSNVHIAFPFEEDPCLEKGHTYIGVQLRDKEQLNNFLKNIKFLHEKESQAKVRKSVYYATDNPLVFVVEGSKFWKDSCWKIMLYTFYLKTLAYPDPSNGAEFAYWKAINKNNNEAALLSKVKIRKEIFSTEVFGPNLDNGVHDREGFVSICTGKNPPMAKLLGVKA